MANRRCARPCRGPCAPAGCRAFPGTRIMSPKAAKITSGCLRHGQARRRSGPWAARTPGSPGPWINSILSRQQILQPEAVDGVRVAAAHFHEAVMARGIGQAANLVRRLCDQFGFAKFIDKSHLSISLSALAHCFLEPSEFVDSSSSPYPCTSCMAASASPSMRQSLHLIEGILLADLAHGKARHESAPSRRAAGRSSCNRPRSTLRRTPTTSTSAESGCRERSR